MRTSDHKQLQLLQLFTVCYYQAVFLSEIDLLAVKSKFSYKHLLLQPYYLSFVQISYISFNYFFIFPNK